MMRAAVVGPLAFLAVPALLWPVEAASLAVAGLQGVTVGAAIGFVSAMATNAAMAGRRR